MSDTQIKLRKEIAIKAAELGKLLYLYEKFCSSEDGDIDVNVVYDYGSRLYDLTHIFDHGD